jgi:uncharacterized protein YaaN involved in tellurite resistance
MAISLTPPTETAGTGIALVAPAPVEEVKEDEVGGILPPLSKEEKEQAKSLALGFTKEVVTMSTKSPEFAAKLNDINNLASAEISRSGEGTNRMLQRATSSVAGAKKGGGDVQVRVAGTLNELRGTIDDLTPNPGDLSVGKKILGFIPGGNKMAKYFQKYESAQTQLDNIIKALMHGADELHKDNGALETEKQILWKTMGELNQYHYVAEEIDKAVVAEIETLRQQGKIEQANALESDVLFPVRQRNQDILTQIAVSVQGYLAMDLVKKNNVELIKGVERARTTTISALRTAITVAQALANQELVLNQIDAINTTTNKMINMTGEMLKTNTARVHAQAASSGVSVETLEKAFNDIFATMDSIDTFKAEANKSMEKTVEALGNQINRTRPYLERSRSQDALQSGNGSARQIAS